MANNREQFLMYKNFHGSAEISVKDKRLFGRVQYVRDAIAYEGMTIEELEAAFVKAIDEYLAFCEEVGDEPDRPFSGSFNVRIGSELHQKAAVAADSASISLNKFIEQAVREKVTPRRETMAFAKWALSHPGWSPLGMQFIKSDVVSVQGTTTTVKGGRTAPWSDVEVPYENIRMAS